MRNLTIYTRVYTVLKSVEESIPCIKKILGSFNKVRDNEQSRIFCMAFILNILFIYIIYIFLLYLYIVVSTEYNWLCLCCVLLCFSRTFVTLVSDIHVVIARQRLVLNNTL